VYHGSPAGPSEAPDWTAEADQAFALFGSAAAGAGDVNHDGFDDLLVGAPLYDNDETDEGRVFVYYGSPVGLALAPDWTAEPDQDFSQFGYSVAYGDVNGNRGLTARPDDVIVGAPQYLGNGGAFAYAGSPSGLPDSPSWTVVGDQGGALFGRSVGAARRVNKDQFSDVIVGASLYDHGDVDEGAAFVFYGSVSGPSVAPDWRAESNQAFAAFGHAVARAGDVNDDGYDDVLIGIPSLDTNQIDAGAFAVYTGSEDGLKKTPRLVLPSRQQGSNLGISVAAAGDVNGDGAADIIVGSWLYDHGESDEGVAVVVHGRLRPEE
jgi:hypothetical protein